MAHSPATPAPQDAREWRIFWMTQSQPWRREALISVERQSFLAQRRSVPEAIDWRMTPFAGVTLTRADLEWLLATHESYGYSGPVDWRYPDQRLRPGLNLCGAILSGEDLYDMPLAGMRGGLSHDEAERFLILKSRATGVPPPTEAEIVAYQERFAIHLEGANLEGASLDSANLAGAHLEGANLTRAYIQGTRFDGAYLQGAILIGATADEATHLDDAILSDNKHGSVALADIAWNGANLRYVRWEQVRILGDEHRDLQTATHAYLQLEAITRSQGLSDIANRFIYRARLCQRRAWKQQGRMGVYLGSAILDLICGWGYRPARAIITYIVLVLLFALLFALGITGHTLSLSDALTTSITAFHGRGFTPTTVANSIGMQFITSLEAIVGMVFEITMIVVFVQRIRQG
jgi:uncharacterized protein YjbI with pentapeptide repeats